MIRDKDQEKADRLHSKFVRDLGICCMKGEHNMLCQGDIISCHIRLFSRSGTGTKPRKREVPMCFVHHGYQHQVGERTFWGGLLESAIKLAGNLHKDTGNKDLGLWHLMGWKQ